MYGIYEISKCSIHSTLFLKELDELDQLAYEDKEFKELAEEERSKCEQELNDMKVRGICG